MPVLVTCACGRKLKARDDQAGLRFRCPRCDGVVVVPAPVVAAPIVVPPTYAPVMYGAASPRPVLVPPDPAVRRAEASWWRGQLHWTLVLFMLPLAWLAVAPDHDDVPARIRATLAANPEVEARVDQTVREIAADIEADETVPRRSDAEYKHALLHDHDFIVEHVIDRVPERRLIGAVHSRSTSVHWLYALGATAVWLPVLALLMPGLPVRPLHLLWTGLFTGTLGVVVLHAVHLVACCVIDPWTNLADDASVPIGARLIGQLVGVGFVEEVVKMLPVLWRLYRDEPIGWREACLWGMASGAGFGISEAIHYCGTFYNGFAPADAYVLRFASAVTLHAVLSGACAIMLQRHQHLLEQGRHAGDFWLTLTAILLAPMTLHAAYNTSAGEGRTGGVIAAALAVASVLWLGHLVTQSRRRERIGPAAPERAGAPVVEMTREGIRVVRR